MDPGGRRADKPRRMARGRTARGPAVYNAAAAAVYNLAAAAVVHNLVAAVHNLAGAAVAEVEIEAEEE